jgi:hypothetical protein
MIRSIDTRDLRAVHDEVQRIHAALFPAGDRAFVPRVFGWAADCFAGRHPGYLAIDARYHDLEHTLQGTLCLAQLLHARQAAGVAPTLTAREFELGIVAILFHDTGYLKRVGDDAGTGAKYTAIHVERSGAFAGEFLAAKGYDAGDTLAVRNMISCTGVNVDLPGIAFRTETERTIGYALGTADLLGQMAADDYLDKLVVLYDEFAEAASYPLAPLPPAFRFASAEALMRSTPGFWMHFVVPKIDGDFRGLYRFLNEPYPDGPNPYVRRIEANLARLEQRLAA